MKTPIVTGCSKWGVTSSVFSMGGKWLKKPAITIYYRCFHFWRPVTTGVFIFPPWEYARGNPSFLTPSYYKCFHSFLLSLRSGWSLILNTHLLQVFSFFPLENTLGVTPHFEHPVTIGVFIFSLENTLGVTAHFLPPITIKVFIFSAWEYARGNPSFRTPFYYICFNYFRLRIRSG